MTKLDEAFTRTGRMKRDVLAKSERTKKTKQEHVAEFLAFHGLRARSFAPFGDRNKVR